MKQKRFYFDIIPYFGIGLGFSVEYIKRNQQIVIVLILPFLLIGIYITLGKS